MPLASVCKPLVGVEEGTWEQCTLPGSQASQGILVLVKPGMCSALARHSSVRQNS